MVLEFKTGLLWLLLSSLVATLLVRRHFRPELLNRLDERGVALVVFDSSLDIVLEKIGKKDFSDRRSKEGLRISQDDDVKTGMTILIVGYYKVCISNIVPEN